MIAFYLLRRGLPTWLAVVPMLFMLVMPAWALVLYIRRWHAGGSLGLAAVAAGMLALEAWMVVEAALLWPKVRGVLEETATPPQPRPQIAAKRRTGRPQTLSEG